MKKKEKIWNFLKFLQFQFQIQFQIWNLKVGIYDMSEISGTELGKCRETVKKRGKLGKWHLTKNTSEITGHKLRKCDGRWTGKTAGNWLEGGSWKKGHWKRRTEKTAKTIKNVEYMIYENGKCMIEEKFWKYESCKWKWEGSIVGGKMEKPATVYNGINIT